MSLDEIHRRNFIAISGSAAINALAEGLLPNIAVAEGLPERPLSESGIIEYLQNFLERSNAFIPKEPVDVTIEIDSRGQFTIIAPPEAQTLKDELFRILENLKIDTDGKSLSIKITIRPDRTFRILLLPEARPLPGVDTDA